MHPHGYPQHVVVLPHVIAVHLWNSVSTDSRQQPETVDHKSKRRETMPNGFQNCICLISQTVQSRYLSDLADRKGKRDELVQKAVQHSEKAFDMHSYVSLLVGFAGELAIRRSIRRLDAQNPRWVRMTLPSPIQTRTLPLTSIRQIQKTLLQIAVVQQVELALAAVVGLVEVR